MTSSIIQVHLGQLKVGTWDIAQSIGIQHRSLKGVLDRYLNKNISFRDFIPLKNRATHHKGGQIKEYLLGEYETRLLFALIMNHPCVPMSLHTFILFHQGFELEYFQKLEECLNQLKSVKQIDVPEK